MTRSIHSLHSLFIHVHYLTYEIEISYYVRTARSFHILNAFFCFSALEILVRQKSRYSARCVLDLLRDHLENFVNV